MSEKELSERGAGSRVERARASWDRIIATISSFQHEIGVPKGCRRTLTLKRARTLQQHTKQLHSFIRTNTVFNNSLTQYIYEKTPLEHN